MAKDDKELFFTGLNILFINSGLIKARANILKKQLEKFGGTFTSKYIPSVITHVLTVPNVTRNSFEKELELKLDEIQCPILNVEWLSVCLTESKLQSEAKFIHKFKSELISEQSHTPAVPVKSVTFPKPVEPPPELYPLGETVLGMKRRFFDSDDGDSKDSEDFNTNTKKYLYPQVVRGKNTAGRWKQNKPSYSNAEHKSTAIIDQLDSDSDYNTTTDDNDDEGGNVNFKFGENPVEKGKEIEYSPPKRKLKGFSCMTGKSQLPTNLNKHITDKLENLAVLYKTRGEKWKERSYSKAVAVLKKHPKEITSWEEAMNLPCIGESLADKVWEIVSSGRLRKLDHLSEDKDTNSISLFSNLWGAGLVTANKWIAQGYRTLDDIREKAELTKQQQVGMKYYEEFIERIPRAEVIEIEDAVKEIIHGINPGLILVTCGSFRRGKSTCGDVDCLISHPDGKSHKGVFQQILQKGHDVDFLTDDLSIHDGGDHNQSKYLGVCLLKGDGRIHRRLDIIVVPYAQWSCAILYFTGSAHFNRSMRLYAQKQGMHLSEHHLYTDVMRKGTTIIHEGTILPTFTEQDIFLHLGLDYLEPHDRDK